MRALVLAVMLSGCGSASPEIYALVFDIVSPPVTCFTNPPATVVSGQLGTIDAEVWDGPEGKGYLSLESTLTVDMGDAPTVTVTPGIALEGTAGPGGWTFFTERTSVTTTPIIGTMNTEKTRLEIMFPRASTAKGTVSLTSSRVCTGTGCPAAMPTCSISGVNVSLTRLTNRETH